MFTTDPAVVYDAAQKVNPPPGADVFLIDLQTTMSVDEAGRLSRTRRAVFRVITELGSRELANMTEPWMAWREAKPSLRVRVITSDKVPHMLDAVTVTEAALPGVDDIYADDKVLQAPLPAIGPGSVVEMQADTGDRESVMPGARFDRYSLAFPYPVHHVVVTIESPKPVMAEARGFAKIDRQAEGPDQGPRRIRFEAWDMKKYEAEGMRPPEMPHGPEILVTTAPSWQSVARWYFELTEPLLQKAAPAPASESDRDQTIRSILAEIQKNVRYTGLELGMGAYRPRTPAETLTRGYGDCKDKATLLISRLRVAGIPAQYALLTPFPFEDVTPTMPGMETFVHVIVYLPGPHPRWIDPTSQFTPSTRIPVEDQGRYALIVDPQTTELVRTPQSGASENRRESEFTIQLQPEKKANFSATEVYTDGTEDFIRSTFNTISTPSQVLERVKTETGRRMKVDKITVLDADPPSNVDKPFAMHISGEGSGSGITAGQFASASLMLDREVLGSLVQLRAAEKSEDKPPLGEVKPARTADYYLPMAMSSQRRHIVMPPPGFRVKQLPEVHELSVAGVKLERTASVRPDNSVVITESYVMPKQRFTVAEAERIAAELKKVGSTSALRIDFVDQVQQLVSDGKEKDALQIARERVAATPGSAVPLIRLASTLSALGANREAIETCLRATALDPKSSEAFAELADLYARDEAGRPFRPGMDRAKAIAAEQKAMALDPADGQLALKLSQLYFTNAKGMIGGTGADYGDAISTLRKVQKDLPKLRAPNALAIMLLADRRYGEVKNLYAEGEAPPSISYRLAAIAASDSVQAAVAAFDGAGTAESREKAFKDAASSLLQNREYRAAAALLREATKEESGSDSDLLEQTRPRENAKYSDQGPIAVTQKLIYALLDQDDTERWKSLYVPSSRFLTLPSERAHIFRLLSAYRQVAKLPLNWSGTADVAVSNGTFVSEGSAETGFRVRMADPSSNGTMKTIAWVVKQGNDYRILGAGGAWALPGMEALAAAKRGDGKAARQWLDWMREEVPSPTGIDPLASLAFTKLWTGESPGDSEAGEAQKPGAQSKEAIAAASLAVRGSVYEGALAVLREAQKQFADGPVRDAIDLAIVQGMGLKHRYADVLPEAKRLHVKFPDSDWGLNAAALTASSAGEDARPVLAERLAKDADSAAALRTEARVFESQRRYPEALESLVKLSHSSKVTAADWNSLAWTSLFTKDIGAQALQAAQTAARLTQNRNPSMVHTLGCVKAATGDTAGARKDLFQYLDSQSEWTDSARTLLGLIQEQLGLTASARHTFEAVEKDEGEPFLSPYALAQNELAHLSAVSTK